MLLCRRHVSGLPEAIVKRNQNQRYLRPLRRRNPPRTPLARQMKGHRKRDHRGAFACYVARLSPRLAEYVILTVLLSARFMIGSSDSDSEDDKRVIRSAKDRRFDELQATCHEIRVTFGWHSQRIQLCMLAAANALCSSFSQLA